MNLEERVPAALRAHAQSKRTRAFEWTQVRKGDEGESLDNAQSRQHAMCPLQSLTAAAWLRCSAASCAAFSLSELLVSARASCEGERGCISRGGAQLC